MSGFDALVCAATSARERLDLNPGQDDPDSSYDSSSSPGSTQSDSPEAGYESSSSSISSGLSCHKRRCGTLTRQQHNRLEKMRRAHQRLLLTKLKHEVGLTDSKASNVKVLRASLKHIHDVNVEEERLRNVINTVQTTQSRLRKRLSHLHALLLVKACGGSIVGEGSVEHSQLDSSGSLTFNSDEPNSGESSVVAMETGERGGDDEEVEVDVWCHSEASMQSSFPDQRTMTSSSSSCALSSTVESSSQVSRLVREARAATGNRSILLSHLASDKHIKMPFGLSGSQTIVTMSSEQLKETCLKAGLHLEGTRPALSLLHKSSSLAKLAVR